MLSHDQNLMCVHSLGTGKGNSSLVEYECCSQQISTASVATNKRDIRTCGSRGRQSDSGLGRQMERACRSYVLPVCTRLAWPRLVLDMAAAPSPLPLGWRRNGVLCSNPVTVLQKDSIRCARGLETAWAATGVGESGGVCWSRWTAGCLAEQVSEDKAETLGLRSPLERSLECVK